MVEQLSPHHSSCCYLQHRCHGLVVKMLAHCAGSSRIRSPGGEHRFSTGLHQQKIPAGLHSDELNKKTFGLFLWYELKCISNSARTRQKMACVLTTEINTRWRWPLYEKRHQVQSLMLDLTSIKCKLLTLTYI